jgi:hypothetical protein
MSKQKSKYFLKNHMNNAIKKIKYEGKTQSEVDEELQKEADLRGVAKAQAPKEEIAKEFIALGIYELMGVFVPKTRLVKGENQEYYLASREEKNFESLSTKWLEVIPVMKKFSGGKVPTSDKKDWKVKGISDLFVASALLSDFDVVGPGYPNIGLLKQNGYYQIYKFDAGFSIISDEDNKLTRDITALWWFGLIYTDDLNNSIDYNIQPYYNYLQSYFKNVVSQVSLEERKESLKKLFAIKRTDIEAIVHKVPDDVLSQEEKKEIVDYLDARIQKMHELYGDQVYRGSYNERIQGRKTGTWMGIGFGALFAVATGLYLGLKKILEPVYTSLVSIGIAAITPIIGTITGSLFYDWPSFIGNKIFTKVKSLDEISKENPVNNYKSMLSDKIDDFTKYTKITASNFVDISAEDNNKVCKYERG